LLVRAAAASPGPPTCSTSRRPAANRQARRQECAAGCATLRYANG